MAVPEIVQPEQVGPAVIPGQEEPKTPITYTEDQMNAVKSAQAGSDRTVSELTETIRGMKTQVDELTKSTMSPEQKDEYEKTIAANTKEKYESEIADLKKESTIMKFLVDKELDPKLSEYLTADNPEDLTIQVASFQEIINKEVSKRLNQDIPGAAKVNTGKVDRAAYLAMTLDEQTAFYSAAPENPGLIRQWKQ